MRIKELAKGDPQLLWPKIADLAKQSHASGMSHLQPGPGPGPLKDPGGFWVSNVLICTKSENYVNLD